MKINATVELDPEVVGVLCPPHQAKDLLKALNELYALIWPEACYDPYNDSTRTFARKLLPHIETCNEIMKFKV